MNPKIASIMEKVAKERSKGNHSKALRRLIDGLEQYSGEQQLYRDVIELGLEAGEPLQSVKYLKKALARFPGERDSLGEFALTLVKRFSDPVLGKHLLEQSAKDWNLISGYRVAKYLDERTVRELLVRLRKKKESLSSALKGGHALDSELAINALSEAILDLRAGRISEAVRLFLARMDGNPQLVEAFEPFLQELENEFPQKGIVRFALGSCYLFAGQLDKGIKKIIQAVKMNSGLAEEAAERLENSHRDIEPTPENLEMALLEIHLARGDSAKISAQARSILQSKPHLAQFILDSLQKLMADDQADWELEKLYLETLLDANQLQRSLQHLRGRRYDADKKRDLYDWLEERLKGGHLPVEIMLFFGQDVLEAGRTEWALKIFRETVVKYPGDAPVVAKILENSHHSSPEIDAFYREIGGRDNAADCSGDFDIQHFERSEFSLSNFNDSRPKPEPAPAPAAPAVDRPSERIIVSERDISIERSTPVERDIPSGAPTPSVQPPDGFQLDELPVLGPIPEPPVLDSTPEPPAAANPGLAGEQDEAADSFEVERSPLAEAAPEPAPIEPPVVRQSVETPVDHRPMESTPDDQQPVEASSQPDPQTEFDHDFQQFLSGKLNNGTTLELIESAFSLGKLEAAEKLLCFQPLTPGEVSRRILCLAELHLHQNRALPALIALKSIDRRNLGRLEKHRFLSLLAASYRALHMFDAANGVLIELLNDKPSDTAIEQLARMNYENYLNECCEGTPVLERTSELT